MFDNAKISKIKLVSRYQNSLSELSGSGVFFNPVGFL
jgi:hypothetical protein